MRALVAVLTCALCATTSFAAGPAPVDPSGIEGAVFDALKGRFKDLSAKAFFDGLPDPGFKRQIDFDPTQSEYFEAVAKQVPLAPVLDAFKANGFAQVAGDKRFSMGSMYQHIYMRDLPVLVTTDSILHALHRSYDELLKQLETEVFVPVMRDVLMATRDRLVAMRLLANRQNVPRAVLDAELDAELYLTVALNLLRGAGGPAEVPYGVGWNGTVQVVSLTGQDAAVLEILQKVQAEKLEGGPETTLYGGQRAVDWSQFKPRGHYTHTPTLQAYFRAMMWLGRADTAFNLVTSPAGSMVLPTRERRAATALALALRAAGKAEALGSVSSVIDFMVGQADDLGVPNFLHLLAQVGFKDASGLAKASLDAALKKQLIATGLGAQRIRSQVLVSYPGHPDVVTPPAIFQLFGQRFLIDSFVLSKVVYDDIAYQGRKMKRTMPKGLDVMAALGNDEAARRLRSELETWQYGSNLQALRSLIDAYPASAWSQNLYWQWLGALRTLDDRPTDRRFFPQAMQTRAWQGKMLRTQQGSWAELRHDTILYGKQSYTAMIGCEYPKAYVEPYPAFYAALGQFARKAQQGLAAAKLEVPGRPELALLKEGQLTFFKRFGEIMLKLEGLARKELAGQPFSAAETEWLRKTIDKRGGGSGPPRYDGWYTELFYGTFPDKWAPTVADVHTDPNQGGFLEVGVGDAAFVVVAIDNGGDRAVYVGPSFTYYEFVERGSRLTDEAWQQRIYNGTLPPVFE
jgi:hypothetical protein